MRRQTMHRQSVRRQTMQWVEWQSIHLKRSARCRQPQKPHLKEPRPWQKPQLNFSLKEPRPYQKPQPETATCQKLQPKTMPPPSSA